MENFRLIWMYFGVMSGFLESSHIDGFLPNEYLEFVEMKLKVPL